MKQEKLKSYGNEALSLAEKTLLESKFFETIALYRTALTALDEISDEMYLNLAWCYLQLDMGDIALQALDKIHDLELLVRDNRYLEIKKDALNRQEGLKKISHHTYIRLKILADKIRCIYGNDLSNCSLMDLGGGAGYLACFLPEVKYFLAEPSVNGISGVALSDFENHFDCVVSCHVFEHINKADRENFLDNLTNAACKHVLLLNPFLIDGKDDSSMYRAALELMMDITKQPWVQEHIEADTPFLSEVENYASLHGYRLEKQANNAGLFTALYVYMEHFAQISGRYDEFAKINNFFNECNHKFMFNAELPNDYLCTIHLTSINIK